VGSSSVLNPSIFGVLASPSYALLNLAVMVGSSPKNIYQHAQKHTMDHPFSTGAPVDQNDANTVYAPPFLLGRIGSSHRLLNTKALVSKRLEDNATVLDYKWETAAASMSRSISTKPQKDGPTRNCLDFERISHSRAGQSNAHCDSFNQTTFIFDWDDTLMPSAWLRYQGLIGGDGARNRSKATRWQRNQLAQIAKAACEMLRQAKQWGTVVIITNADRGWVEANCHKFMPTLYPLLDNIRIISARTSFMGHQPSSPSEWKLAAFQQEIQRLYGSAVLSDHKCRKNVISIGDGPHERKALLASTASLPNCFAKTVKFVDLPDINELSTQQSLIANDFEQIVNHVGNLDLRMKGSCSGASDGNREFLCQSRMGRSQKCMPSLFDFENRPWIVSSIGLPVVSVSPSS